MLTTVIVKPIQHLMLCCIIVTTSMSASANTPAAQRAEEALASGLPEVAAKEWRTALKNLSDQDPLRPQLTLRLAEALVRSGQAAEAINLLKKPALEPLPEQGYWNAQALASTGRFEEALALFDSYLSQENGAHRIEATHSSASLLMAMGKTEDAFELVSSLAASNKPEIRLLLAEIALRKNRANQALEVLSAPSPQGSDELADQIRYTKARAELRLNLGSGALATAESMQSDPIPGARDLLKALSHQSLSDESAALDSILKLIKEHPDSPFIPHAFKILLSLKNTPAQSTLERLDRWANSPEKNLSCEALFARAEFKARNSNSLEDASKDWRSLIAKFPNNYLADSAKLKLASFLVGQEKTRPEAQQIIENLIATSLSPEVRSSAALIKSKILLAEGNPLKAKTLLKTIASNESNRELVNRAVYNLSLLDLATSKPLIEAQEKLPQELRAKLAYEQALISSQNPAMNEISLLSSAIHDYPDHPLKQRAQLTLAAKLLQQKAPPKNLLKDLMASLQQSPPNGLLQEPYHRVKIAFAKLEENWPNLISEAKSYLQTYPETPYTPQLHFDLGLAHFKSGDFNQAQLEFATLEDAANASPNLKQNALYLTAFAAAKTGTKQAAEQAIEHFEKLSSSETRLGKRSRIDAARLLFRRLDKPREALENLEPLTTDQNDFFRREALTLQAEIFAANASDDPSAYRKAQASLDQILGEKNLPSTWRQRSLIRRAEVAELAGDSSQALADYFKVVTATPNKPSGSPSLFEQAGFASMRLLEQQQRWDAAAKMADRIAEAGGPRAAEARKRAEQLRANH